jgi:Rhodopirellula transposase DDE domain
VAEHVRVTCHETIINLIGATTTTTGLTVTAQFDTAPGPAGVKVSDRQMKNLPITRDPWHGEWNYTISAHSVLA